MTRSLQLVAGGIDPHGAELVAVELFSPETGALLLEEYGARRRELDGYGDGDENHGRTYQHD